MSKSSQPRLPFDGHQVRLIPDVSAAAFKQKLVLECGLWFRLRVINHWGSSFLDTESAIEGLRDHFGYSRSSAQYQLHKAEGKFLQVKFYKGRSTIKIWGIKRVCQYLGIGRITDAHFREIPVAEFHRDRTASQLFASLAKPEGIKGNPMPRDVITERTGLHKVQQRRYEKREHIKRTPNFAFYQDDGALGRDEIKPLKQEIFSKKKGFRDVNKRLGNTYHSRQQPGSRGMLRRVNAELGGSSTSAEAPTLIKRYFGTFRGLFKTLTRRTESQKEGAYLLPTRKRIKRGRLEWCFVDIRA